MNESLHTPAAPTTSPTSLEAAPVPETPSAVPEAAPAPPAAEEGGATGTDQQRSFLLQQLADAPDRKLPRGMANRKITKVVAKTLNLDATTADRVREALAAEGLIRLTRRGQAVSYELTDEGAAYLETLPPLPLPPGRGPTGPREVGSEPGTEQQRTFLLQQIAEAPERTLFSADANRKLKKAEQEQLGLDAQKANRIRAGMADEGHIRIGREERRAFYQLTDAGAAYLATLPPLLPPGFNPPSNEEVEALRKWYLMLNILKEESDPSARKSTRNDAMGKALELNAPTAAYIRRGLCVEGLVESQGKERFALTPQGLARLGTSPFPADRTFALRSEVLNRLLEAAREAAREEFPPEPPAAAPALEERPAPQPEELAPAVLEAFEELHREKYQRTGLTPIHEVRRMIREKHGEKAATHGILDDVIQELRRSGQVRLTPIADLGQATSAQLDDSIQGLGETLFYMEPVHEHAVL